MSIATTIPAITAYTGAVPDKATMTKTVFANSINPYLNYVDDTFIPSYEAAKTALNSAITEINEEIVIINADSLATAADVVLTHADVVLTHADVVLTHADVVAAAALLDSFDDRYLGSKVSAPTLDNDGNALQSGALYYNTTSDTMFVYDLDLTTWIALTFTPTDHGSLTGLADDDHTQYHNDTRGDARYLKLAGGSLTGELLATAGVTVGGDIAFTQIDKGTVSTGTVTFTQSDGNVQRLQVGGALTIATTGWHTTGTYSDLVLQLVNAGSATVTLPTINWIKPDGTVTTTFSVYLTAIARPALQTSGVDFMYLFTVDGGITVYGKLI